MKLNAKKLAVGVALLSLLAVGAALPAAAAAPVALSLPSIQWPWENVAVQSIELGDYASTMTVGATQQLSPTVLPANATNRSVAFVSENSSVLAVTDTGLVQAVAAGSTRIAVTTADGVTNYYSITVQADPSTFVTEMDLTLSTSRIAVGDTASVQVQVLPTNAGNLDQLSLTSSNTAVATVNSFGKVTGIAPGTATITASCGAVSASAKITVVAASSGTVTTEHITLNTSYVVLKPGATQTLKASVTPSSASQSFTFKSNDPSVAAVSAKGVITAVGTGATSIVVSNGTASASVTVIVNRTAAAPADPDSGSTDSGDGSTELDPVVQAIQDAADAVVTLPQSEAPVLTADVLNALRTTGKTLELTADGYTLRLAGEQIKNTGNALYTALTFTEVENGVEFTLNEGESMPATVEIEFAGNTAGYKRLYLYNNTTSKWQYLNSYANGVLKADTAGRYLLTNETISSIQVNWFFLGAAALVLVAIGVVYIVVKKRYWFW